MGFSPEWARDVHWGGSKGLSLGHVLQHKGHKWEMSPRAGPLSRTEEVEVRKLSQQPHQVFKARPGG